jgi:hypothetical protein
MREIMLVPFPRAASKALMSFLIFHNRMFASSSALIPFAPFSESAI